MSSTGAKLGKKTTRRGSKAGAKKPDEVKLLQKTDFESYTRMRQAIDSFQALSLYFYANGQDSGDRKERAERIKEFVIAFQNQMYDTYSNPHRLAGCPRGTYNCDGVCLPLGAPC